MPTFDTREPITATIDVVSGDVRITAGACPAAKGEIAVTADIIGSRRLTISGA